MRISWKTLALALTLAACGPGDGSDDKTPPTCAELDCGGRLCQEGVCLDHGKAQKLVFRLQPAPSTAGQTLEVSVAAHDAQGRVDKTFSGNIQIFKDDTSPGAGPLLSQSNSKQAKGGIALFGIDEGLKLTVAGEYRLLAAADGLQAGTSESFKVSPAGPATLVFASQPASVKAGEPLGLEVVARDEFGNTATGFSGEVTLSRAEESQGTGELLAEKATLAASEGVARFGQAEAVRFEKAGTYLLLADGGGLARARSAEIGVTAAAASRLVFAGQPVNTTAGATIPARIEAQDAFGNVDPAFVGKVLVSRSATSSGTGPLRAEKTSKQAVAGVAEFGEEERLRYEVVGRYALDASSGTFKATSASFEVKAAAGARLAFALQPGTTAAGDPIALTVSVLDAFGNASRDFVGDVSISKAPESTGKGALLATSASRPATGGLANFGAAEALRFEVVGNYLLVASAPGLAPATSAPFTIRPAAARQLVFAAQPEDVVVGGPLAFSLTAYDPFGNLDTAFAGTVTISKSATSTGAGPLVGTLKSKKAAAGKVEFGAAEGLTFRVAGAYALEASATGLSPATTALFSATPGDPSGLAFLVQPSAHKAGGSFSPAVEVGLVDKYANPVAASGRFVTVRLTGGTAGAQLTGEAYAMSMNGVARFASLGVDRAGTGYALEAESSGLAPATSATFDVESASPGPSQIIAPPGSARAGEVIEVAAELLDRTGHPIVGALVQFEASGVSTLEPVRALTGGDGRAVGRFATAKAGEAVIRAAANGVRLAGQATIPIVSGEPSASGSWLAVRPANALGRSGVVEVFVGDRFGNPVAGARVVLSSDRAARIEQPSRLSGADGRARGTVVALASGRQTISATVGGQVIAQAEAGLAAGSSRPVAERRTDAEEPLAAGRAQAWKLVTSGGAHSLGIRGDGSLWAWGENVSGQLGDGTAIPRAQPGRIAGRFVAASAGEAHSAAVDASGFLWTWGSNCRGQLGDGTTVDRPEPVRIGADYVSVSAGRSLTVAVRSDGTLWAWGQLSRAGLSGSRDPEPVPVRIAERVASAVAGDGFILALGSGGALFAWGADEGVRGEPEPRIVGDGFTKVAAGGRIAAAVKADGTLWAWEGLGGQPEKLGEGVAEVAAGWETVLGLGADGSLRAWRFAQGRSAGAPAELGTGHASVAIGGRGVLAIMRSGALEAWPVEHLGLAGDAEPTAR